MNDGSDPPRWRHGEADAPVELTRLMSLGRAEVGSSDDIAELARRLSAALGPAAGLPAGADLPTPSGAAEQAVEPPASGPRPSADGSAARVASKLSGSAARWIAGAIGGTGLVAGLWWAFAAPPSAPREPAPAFEARPDADGDLPAGVAVAQPAAPALPPAPAPEPEPSRDVSTPESEPRGRERPRPAPHVRAPRPGGEAQLLERAQAALAFRPAEALRLTREHEARFPRGALVQEREVIAIDALERLGRAGAAKARAAAFERRFRGSVHHPRVRRTTDTSVPPGGGPATLPQ